MSQKSKLSAIFEAVDSIDNNIHEAESTYTAALNEISNSQVHAIPLTAIYVDPTQFRRYFGADEQEKLKKSIRQNGFQGAILLRRLLENDRKESGETYEYELVYGESRYRAVASLGHKTIPAIVRDLNDQQVRRIRLDENLVRKNLNPLEEVEGLLQIAADELEVTPKKVISILDEFDVAPRRNRKLSGDVTRQVETLQGILDYYKKGTLTGFLTKLRRLKRLPDDIKKAVEDGVVDWTKAIEIAPVKDEKVRKKLLRWLISENPTTKEIRERLRALRGEGPPKAPMENKAQNLLTRVRRIKTWQSIDPAMSQELEAALSSLETTLKKLESIGNAQGDPLVTDV